MQLLVIVLNKIQKLDDLLLELNNNGVTGGTIIDTTGMVQTLVDGHDNISLFGSLKHILNENKPINKTLFMVLSDDKVSIAMDCVRKVVSNIEEENTGIMFTVPVGQVEGLTK